VNQESPKRPKCFHWIRRHVPEDDTQISCVRTSNLTLFPERVPVVLPYFLLYLFILYKEQLLPFILNCVKLGVSL
jgi:hypothetical protein